LVKGLVEYRQGHYAGAQDWAQKSLAGSGTNCTTTVAAGAVLAMAQQQVKQTDDPATRWRKRPSYPRPSCRNWKVVTWERTGRSG
jgi:hypothetical protein